MSRSTAYISALTALVLLLSPIADAGESWFLFSRHGECSGIGVLKRKVPDLGEINDPYAFADFMKRKGFKVTSSPLPVPAGKVQEVIVPERELSLLFVTSDLCTRSGSR